MTETKYHHCVPLQFSTGIRVENGVAYLAVSFVSKKKTPKRDAFCKRTARIIIDGRLDKEIKSNKLCTILTASIATVKSAKEINKKFCILLDNSGLKPKKRNIDSYWGKILDCFVESCS